MAQCSVDSTHARLVAFSAEDQVNHHPFCGAHPGIDDGPCQCAHGQLAALIRALIDRHQPRPSRSINTLSCDAHNVRNHPPDWRNEPDYDACPTCVVTPTVVCSNWGCEEYPCETVTTILGVIDSRVA